MSLSVVGIEYWEEDFLVKIGGRGILACQYGWLSGGQGFWDWGFEDLGSGSEGATSELNYDFLP